MKIIKRVQGDNIELEIVKIKEYPRYSLYDVYKNVNGKRKFLYKQCYTKLQLNEIKAKGFCIDEEIFK